MQTEIQIPADYTACEPYRGHVIAIRHNSYSIFTETGARYPEHYGDRASARRSIDQYIRTA